MKDATKSTAAVVQQPASAIVQAAIAEGPQKPTRQVFYHDVVINAKGEVIDDANWKDEANSNLTGRALSGNLRKKGLQLVHVFDRDGYEQAKKQYAENMKKEKSVRRETLIVDAFARASIPPESRIEKALKDLLPMFENVTPAKTVIVFKNIIKTVDRGLGQNHDNHDGAVPA